MDTSVLEFGFFVLKLGAKCQQIYCFSGEKLQNKSKLIAYSSLILLLCSVLVSIASATDEDVTREPTSPTPVSSDNPVLIVTQDNVTTTSDGDASTYPARDNGTAAAIDSQAGAGSNESSENSLISTKSSPDYTVFFTACATVVAVIVLSTLVVVLKKRREQKR
jgi:hypothetical protein